MSPNINHDRVSIQKRWAKKKTRSGIASFYLFIFFFLLSQKNHFLLNNMSERHLRVIITVDNIRTSAVHLYRKSLHVTSGEHTQKKKSMSNVL